MCKVFKLLLRLWIIMSVIMEYFLVIYFLLIVYRNASMKRIS